MRMGKSDILDMVCAMTSFENENKDNEERLQSDVNYTSPT
jgi:hypothetical protein